MFAKTSLEFNDFIKFINTDQESKTYLQSIISNQDQNPSLHRKDLRKLLSKYVEEQIQYSYVSSFNFEKFKDRSRSYFAHKAVKDFIILTGK